MPGTPDESISAVLPRRAWPSPCAGMASPLFFKGLLDDLGFETLFGIHLLEPTILSFQFLHALEHGNIHATVLGAPIVKAGITHAVLAAKLCHRNTALGFFQNTDDL